MKKFIKTVTIIGTVISIFSVFAHAQSSAIPGLYTGLGIYQEKQSFTGGNASTSPAAGLVLGGVIDIPVSQNISVRPGLIFVSRGGGAELINIPAPDGTVYTDSMISALHYLTIPLDFKFKYPIAPDITAYALVGVNLGMMMSATGHVTTTGVGSGDIDIAGNYNSLDFGLDLGGGIEFVGQDFSPFFELSYYSGLANTTTLLPATISSFSQSNGGLEIRAGVKFKPGILKRFFQNQ